MHKRQVLKAEHVHDAYMLPSWPLPVCTLCPARPLLCLPLLTNDDVAGEQMDVGLTLAGVGTLEELQQLVADLLEETGLGDDQLDGLVMGYQRSKKRLDSFALITQTTTLDAVRNSPQLLLAPPSHFES